jgi:hypothetical protein
MIIIQHMLDGTNGSVQVGFIESAFAPTPGEVPQLAFGVRQSFAIAMPEMPNRIAAVEIGVHAIDQRGNCFRPITAVWWPELRLRHDG